ncbi:hypothetical protein [Eubacterium sp.]|uniref:hypothetical protein n=1 Tax=Eubacterium sp. TaxID=142586 RepID=UPI003F0161BA
MYKNSTIPYLVRFVSAFLFLFVIFGIITFALDVQPFQFTPSFIFVNGSRFVALLISSLYFLLSETSISFKTKLFPSTKKFDKFLNSMLSLQMYFALCTCLLTLRFSLLEGAFTSAYSMQNIAFSAFFVLLYLSNKISINKVFIYISGGVYIGFWYAYNFFTDYVSIDISDIIPLVIIVFYMLFFGLFPTPSLKLLFYYNVIEETFNDEETEMICISAVKNDKGEIEMLMITDRQEYVIYNRSTKEKTLVDEDNYMSINEDLQKDLGLFIICNR